MGHEISGSGPAVRPPAPTRPNAEHTQSADTENAAARAQTSRPPPPDRFSPAASAPLVLNPALPPLEGTGDVAALREEADDLQAPAEERLRATQQLGVLAAQSGALAIGALRELTILHRDGAAVELLRAPAARLSGTDYRLIAEAAGESLSVQAELRSRVMASDAGAIDGLSEAVLRADPNRDAFVGILAGAPESTLTSGAYEALGAGAAGGNALALERLRSDAQGAVPGAVEGLEALARSGVSSGARDLGLAALASAATSDPAAFDVLRRAHAEGWAEGSDGANAYFSATARLEAPAQLASEVRALQQSGELADFADQIHPDRLRSPALRGELMAVALGPPRDEAVREALLTGLDRVDATEHSAIHAFADEDLAAAGTWVATEIARRAQQHPKMEQLSSLIQIAQRTQADPTFARQIDAERLQAQLRSTLEDPDVSAQMAEIRAQSDVLGTADRLAARLEDPLYAERLQLMSPEARQSALAEDVGQLAQLDPVRAQAAVARLAATTIAADPASALAALTEDQRARAAETLAPELGLSPGTVSAWIGAVVRAKRLDLPVPGVDQWLGTIPEGERARALELLGTEGKQWGHLATALTAVGLVDSLAEGDVSGALRGGIDLAGSAGDLLELAGVSDGFLMSAAKGAGAMASVASVYFSARDAGQEWHRGDKIGTFGNGLIAVGGGLAATSIFTGPDAPVVALVGFGFSAAGSAVNLFSETDLESFARNQGLLSDRPA